MSVHNRHYVRPGSVHRRRLVQTDSPLTNPSTPEEKRRQSRENYPQPGPSSTRTTAHRATEEGGPEREPHDPSSLQDHGWVWVGVGGGVTLLKLNYSLMFRWSRRGPGGGGCVTVAWPGSQGVRGSNPLSSTHETPRQRGFSYSWKSATSRNYWSFTGRVGVIQVPLSLRVGLSRHSCGALHLDLINISIGRGAPRGSSVSRT